MQRANLIHPLDTVVQGKDHIVSDMDGEKVMLSIRNGKYYNLGEIGGDIWDLIAAPSRVEAVVDALIGRYDVERDRCEDHVLAFLARLADEKLIEVERS
ncbi:lasso peptide biosynthesis PqqD family chaperone [Paenibacillus antri]|uniref:Lasso peptide biosynthesis PqqD family chaperone n=1 Tax=Paenibacillus antri TaxID=2582848 RepID=A0A5R9G8K3_9BACL|nr:lasso peptide biosynthesis PqqD family chaperone [Paenibacillus antri]TLS49394.1 lasso peptide biosynthesis PqqD family chaperone [Paenibacillus antri]